MKNGVAHLSHCGGPYDLTEANLATGYNAYPGTLAEQAMIAFLGANPDLVAGKRILHVGLGNSSIFRAYGHRFAAFTGLTVGLPEKLYFEATFGCPANVEIHLANKHDPRNYAKIQGPFDLIIDVNLKSFACCEVHFHDMLMFYVARLNHGGVVLTAASGLAFGWPGNTPQACTPGAAADSASQAWRILGEDGLKDLAEQYGLSVESHELRGIPHWQGMRDTSGPPIISDETLWMLKK